MNLELADFPLERFVALSSYSTLGVGGPCSYLARLGDEAQAENFMQWWLRLPAKPPILPLGGGSNLLVSDLGFEGLVVKLENDSYQVLEENDESVLLGVGAGMVWDDLVTLAVEKGWGGIECLSGIPGSVGAAPVQNIGAYGQEVSESIVAVEGYDLTSGKPFRFSGLECSFSYRNSIFKRAGTDKYLIVRVELRLRPGASPTVRYADLIKRCQQEQIVSLWDLRQLVIDIRRSKSMLYHPSDPNHRSAGSFFTNPIVEESIALKLVEETGMPCYTAGNGYKKLSAAWLIEHSGLKKGFSPSADSRVGLSSNHVLAIINKGGASAREIVDFAGSVIEAVQQSFAVTLVPEPVFIGFKHENLDHR